MSILPPPPNFLQICGQLLRYFTKISPRRAKSTPVGNFCLCLVSVSSLFKRLTQKLFLTISPHYSALFIYPACCVYPDMAIISEQFIAQVRHTEVFSFGDFPCIISVVDGGVLAKSLRKPLKLRFLEVPV